MLAGGTSDREHIVERLRRLISKEAAMADDAYETRLIAFADILGWTKAINDLSKFKCLLEIITSIADYARNFSPDVKAKLKTTPGVPHRLIEDHSGIEFSYFSDSFFVSVPVAHGQSIFNILSWANDRLLRKEFAVRGGVTIGDLYHKQ